MRVAYQMLVTMTYTITCDIRYPISFVLYGISLPGFCVNIEDCKLRSKRVIAIFIFTSDLLYTKEKNQMRISSTVRVRHFCKRGRALYQTVVTWPIF